VYGRFQKVAPFDKALALLVEHRFLREETPAVEPGRRGRKPAPVYHVNPAASSYNSYNPYNSRDAGNSRGSRNSRTPEAAEPPGGDAAHLCASRPWSPSCGAGGWSCAPRGRRWWSGRARRSRPPSARRCGPTRRRSSPCWGPPRRGAGMRPWRGRSVRARLRAVARTCPPESSLARTSEAAAAFARLDAALLAAIDREDLSGVEEALAVWEGWWAERLAAWRAAAGRSDARGGSVRPD
jgi:hypothetical protein